MRYILLVHLVECPPRHLEHGSLAKKIGICRYFCICHLEHMCLLHVFNDVDNCSIKYDYCVPRSLIHGQNLIFYLNAHRRYSCFCGKWSGPAQLLCWVACLSGVSDSRPSWTPTCVCCISRQACPSPSQSPRIRGCGYSALGMGILICCSDLALHHGGIILSAAPHDRHMKRISLLCTAQYCVEG